MLSKILIAFAALVAVVLIIAALKPAAYRVERSITISAPAAAIFPYLNDFHRTEAWNPWLKLDPAAKLTYDGPASGVGASSTWAGNNQVGEGRQTIVESRPNELVRNKLEFKKPFEDVATAELTLKPQGPSTVVTWSMFGESKFFARVICLFMNQDKMIGGPFEEGLAKLKRIVESGGKS